MNKNVSEKVDGGITVHHPCFFMLRNNNNNDTKQHKKKRQESYYCNLPDSNLNIRNIIYFRCTNYRSLQTSRWRN